MANLTNRTLDNGWTIKNNSGNGNYPYAVYDTKGNMVATLGAIQPHPADKDQTVKYKMNMQGYANKSDYNFTDLNRALKSVFDPNEMITMGGLEPKKFSEFAKTPVSLAQNVQAAATALNTLNKTEGFQGNTAVASQAKQAGKNDDIINSLSAEKNRSIYLAGQGTYKVSDQDIARWTQDGTIDAWKKQGVLPKSSISLIDSVGNQVKSKQVAQAKATDPNALRIEMFNGVDENGKPGGGKSTYYITKQELDAATPETLDYWKKMASPDSLNTIQNYLAGNKVTSVTGDAISANTMPIPTEFDNSTGKPVAVNAKGDQIQTHTNVESGTVDTPNYTNNITNTDTYNSTTGNATTSSTSGKTGSDYMLPDIWSDYGGDLTLETSPEEKLVFQKVMDTFKNNPTAATVKDINRQLQALANNGTISNDFISKISKPLENYAVSNDGLNALKNVDQSGAEVQAKVNQLGATSNPAIANLLSAVNKSQSNPYLAKILESVGGNEFIKKLDTTASGVTGDKTAQQAEIEKILSERMKTSEGDYAKRLYEQAANPILQESARQAKEREARLFAKGLGNATISENLSNDAERELNNTLAGISNTASINAKQYVNDVIQNAITQAEQLQSGVVAQGQNAANIKGNIQQSAGQLQQAMNDLASGKAVDAATIQNVMNEMNITGMAKAGELEQAKNELNSGNIKDAATLLNNLYQNRTQNASAQADVIGQTNQQNIGIKEALTNAIGNQAQAQNVNNANQIDANAQGADILQQILANSMGQSDIEKQNLQNVLDMLTRGENREIYNQQSNYDEFKRRVDLANNSINQALSVVNGQMPINQMQNDNSMANWKANLAEAQGMNQLVGNASNAISSNMFKKNQPTSGSSGGGASVGQVLGTNAGTTNTGSNYTWEPLSTRPSMAAAHTNTSNIQSRSDGMPWGKKLY